MLDLGTSLKNHQFMWIRDGFSPQRGVCFYYREIVCKNPAHKLSVINAGLPNRPNWYYWLFVDGQRVCCNRHFKSEGQALEAAWEWSDEMPQTPRLRPYGWFGQQAYTIDGLLSTDVTILEFHPDDWRFQAVEDHKRILWTGSWLTAEKAMAAYLESLKVN